MPKRKQKAKKNSQIKSHILIFAALLFVFSILFIIINVNQNSQRQAATEQRQSSNSNTKNSLQNPAVAEAKAIADEYFEAARNCDLERANSLRLLPNNTAKTKEECQKECPGGLRYKFLKPVTYSSQESGGIVTEFAAFDYVASCSDKTTPLLIQLIRSSDDYKWQILNTM